MILQVSGSDIEGDSIPLVDGCVVVIGRAPGSTILLDSATVSRRHAEVRSREGTLEIADMGSANGTLLNQRELPVKEWQRLNEGDLIEIGPFDLKVSQGDVEGGQPTQLLGAGTLLIAAAGTPALRIESANAAARDFPLTAATYNLGRDLENDIVIGDPSVSRMHARLEKKGASYEIVDLNSLNGLYLDGEKVSRRLLEPGDALKIGQSVQLKFRAASAASAASAAEAAREPVIDLRGASAVELGRGVAGEGAIDHPQVSRVHARIVHEDGRLIIEDAGSEMGTFVNGTKVVRHVLSEGDAIRLGGQSLRLVNGQLLALPETELTLDAVNLRRVIPSGATILHDVSMSINAREFLAIVGPSGAGKSTLINALCGYQRANSGKVLINGTDFYSHIEAFRSDIGFVPQDDIIHRELDVNKAFAYAGRLRMPQDTRARERDRRSSEVLEELGLTAHARTEVRRLSGGQRKRVSIGVELLTQPSLLFLDEATSGLDPGTETQMMKLFRHLADNGRIVVLVTHATKNVMICDKVIFMARGGHVAFYGPPEEALAYFETKDFDEIYVRLEERPGEEWGRLFHSRFQNGGNGFRGPALAAAQLSSASEPTVLETAPPRSSLRQFLTLTARNLEILRRSPKDVAVLFALAPFLGLLNFLLWGRDTFDPVRGDTPNALSLFFMLTIVALLVGSLGSVREIVKEQAIYRRERMVCVRVLPYVMSKVFVGFLFALYSGGMLFLLQVVSVDFSYLGITGYLQLFVPAFLATFSGVMIGLTVSAISATEERAMLLIIAVIIPQFLLSGGFLPIKTLFGIGPYLTAAATARWAYAALITTSRLKSGACAAPDLSDCSLPGMGSLQSIPDKQALLHSLDRHGSIFQVNIYEQWAAMATIILITMALVLLLQYRKDVSH